MNLPTRQMQTARLVRLGYTNKEIADCMGLQPGTVKMVLEGIYVKLEAQTRHPRVELATWYVRKERGR